ncbi:MAG: putative periplasmic lipoprotein [Gammaproteobacteria bacterium]
MKRYFLIILGTLFLSGCAAEKNIQLSDAFWQQKQNKIAVAGVKPAKPGVIKVGSQGLLDMAINSAMTHKLDTHLSKTDLSWYYSLPNDMASKLKQRHVAVIVAGSGMEVDEKRTAIIATEHHVNDVLVMRLQAVGVIRRYSGFIPIGAPEAYCVLKGELIDSTTKEVKWRHLAEVKLPVNGEWDQPPTFPNVTSTVREAITASRQEILDSFFSGH